LAQDAETQASAQQTAATSVEEHETALRIQEEARQRLEEQVAALGATIADMEPAIASRQRELASAEQTRQEADRAVDRLQTRLDLLQRLHDEGAGYASGVRTILQRAQGGDAQLAGVLGTVAAMLHVPSHLDKAIETALGGAMQNIVTRDWRTAQAAIDRLKQSGQGRATFLPLDRLHVLPGIAAPNSAGVLGNAADLVDYDGAISDAVAQLLGRVWVAEDLPAARRALDAHTQGPRPTVVTVAGEIIRPGGSVTGGSDRSRRDDSILARERELREQQTQQTLADLMRTERQQNQQIEALRRQHDRALQAVQWQTERLGQTMEELTRLDEREVALNLRLAELATVRQSNATDLATAESDVAQSGVDDLLRQLADLRAAAAEAQGHLRSQQTLLENQRRNLQSIVDQIEAKERRIVELGAESEGLQEQIDRLDTHEDELSTKISGLRQEIEPAETELAALERNQADEEKRERTLQQLLRNDESSWNHAQLQRQRAEDTIAQLHREIEHDLGLVTLEESDDVAYQPPLPLATFVEELPVVKELPDGLEGEVREMRARLSRVSNVNPEAPREYEEAAERHGFLISQSEDLEAAARDLRKVIRELDDLMEVELDRTFKAVSVQFEHFFKLLFNGGTAKLVLTEPDNITETGIEIIARPPGKRPQSLALLSGGERALSACALIFAILRVSPTPFCVLDEVDAALDEANVDRFRQTVEDELSADTQFIIVTHNRRTLEGANAIYGVTMGDDGVSKVISLKLENDKIVQADGQGSDEVKEIEGLVQM
jgi:chromosome segregation protein